MPTMISKRLGDLEAERESFVRHEQRIIQERDEILGNIRRHLDQLDEEIVKLGGIARSASSREASNATLPSSSSANAFVPSIEAFPSAASGSEETKKPRGRPRKSEEGAPGGDGKAGTAKRKRGRPKKERPLPSHALFRKKENVPSDDASPDEDGALPGAKRRRTVKSASDPDQSAFTATGKILVRDESPWDDKPWTCECGQQLPAARARCGKCRKWRGGKRLTRWKVPSLAGKSKAAKKAVAPLFENARAIGFYKNLPDPPAPKPSTEASVDAPENEGANDQRAEIAVILGKMALSVADAHLIAERTLKGKHGKGSKRAGGSKEKAEPGTSTSKKISGDEPNKKGSEPIKRKRGRPKKISEGSKGELIQRVVSTSDSDSTEAPRELDPTKEPLAEGGATSGDASLSLEGNPPSTAKSDSVVGAHSVVGSFVQSVVQSVMRN